MVQRSETQRLQSLESFGVVDTPPEEAFDRVTALAADLFDAPMALISLITADRQWFKSRQGVDVTEIPRSRAFCSHAILLGPNETLVVEDATRDARFADNPLVTGPPHIRFYAGAVLTGANGDNLGALCVLDRKPRKAPSPRDLDRLKALARIVVDELDLHRAHGQATERRQLLEMAEHISGIGHWRFQVADGRLDWSDEVYRIHGVDRATFRPGLTQAFDFYPATEREAIKADVAEAIRSGHGYQVERRLRRADGAIRDIACKAECIQGPDGKTAILYGVFQDVTDYKVALAGVERGRARYKLLADNAADVITRIRFDGSSNYISPAIAKLLGYKPAEMAGQPAQAFVYAPDRPLIMATFDEMAKGAAEKTVQHRAARKDGSPVWVETHFQLLRDAAGAPSEIVAVIRDVTERKALEAELDQARLDAEAAAAVKAEFLANMSHELRTPLTSIIGFTRLAGEQPELSALTRDYVERVGNASSALLATVNDILDFSKLEAGQVTIKPAPTAISKLAHSTLDLFAPEAGAKDLTLQVDDEAGFENLTIAVDPDRIRQILLNLVGNAVKFTAAGRVTLRLRHDPVGEELAVDVVDTGVGIAAADLERLFQRFSQIDGSLSRAHGGSGLGLAICKGLVEAMGGQIGAESRVGEGSRFWFRIPAALCTQTQGANEPVEADPAPFVGVRVLVIDDHASNRELARLFLSGIGAEVTEAEDGEQGVQMAAAAAFDVILMDMRMPRLDGLAALGLIRGADGPNAATPILAFTADCDLDAVQRLVALGFDDVVAKPVDPGLLIAAVARAAAFQAAGHVAVA